MFPDIDAERGRLRMPQQHLANKLGVYSSTFKNWMNGRSDIPASALVEMTRLFNCTTDYLLGLSDKRRYEN